MAKPLNSKKGLIALVLAGLFIAGANWVPNHLNLTVSPSLSQRVFWLTEFQPEKAWRGQCILFERQLPGAPTTQVTKMMSCLPGDTLTVKGLEYFCNGASLGVALEKSTSGKTLDRFQFNGQIPEGNYFVMGHNPKSYDSRYFGFIQKEEIKHEAIPLF